MFEDEDMILPDDFQDDTPQSEEVTDTLDTEDTFDTPDEPEAQPQATDEAEQPVSPFLKVKFNHEEMELDEMTARELAQKGLNYDKVQEKLQALESDPRLNFIESLANQNGMTADEYIQAVTQQMEQSRIDELVQQNIPEEYAREMLESRKFREQLEQERQTKAQQEKQNAEYNEFFEHFKQANGRDFDSNKDEIPESVWQATQSGVPLKFAYMAHENEQLRQQLQTHKQNVTNANRAPVSSTTAHGGTEIASEDPFLAGFESY
ncbi:hypothetical protein J1P26_07410 [Neobacillus sp. MM2021_6]|uniref:hypothetical protein n=1 Tax=Bacillaceae TaxID=186817 RepID=UPI00140B7A65|nr:MULTISPECIES: hypothetical protein [Bacillaceae]MBO0959560.1 hypothetical protein [Neobacillus sp. MM2021_6]NHC17142.1 hypothetical protein [Bacillus sp. MM2020_4]